jgi:transposase
MMRTSRFSPEVRERAVRMVLNHAEQYESQWEAINAIAAKVGCSRETLRQWVREAESRGQGPPGSLTIEERERLKRLERENFELKRANEILRKASAYFAQAELDRPEK